MQVQEGSEPNHQHVARTEQAQLCIHPLDEQPVAPTEGMCWTWGHGHPGWDTIHSIGERPVCPSAGV